MAVHSVLQPKQDLPPPGGYKKIKWTSGVPKRGMSGLAMFTWVLLYHIPVYYIVCRQMDLYYYRRQENRDTRIAIMPFMMAERDRKQLLSLRRDMMYEEELMRDIDGWELNNWFDEPRFVTQDKDKWYPINIGDSYMFCSFDEWQMRRIERHFF